MPDALPVLPVRDTVVYPQMAAPILVGQPRTLELLHDLKGDRRLVVVVTEKEIDRVPPAPDDLYRVGTMAAVRELARMENVARVIVHGIERVRIVDFVRTHPYMIARVQAAVEPPEEGVEIEGLTRTVRDLFVSLVRIAGELSDELSIAADAASEPAQLAYLVAATTSLSTAEKQEILEIDTVSGRLRRLVDLLQHELAVRRVIERVSKETAEEVTKAQREHILRKHMESIQRELGELEPGAAEARELRQRLDATPLSDEARKEAAHEIDRLEHTPEASPEYGMIRTYLDWLLKMPWGKRTGKSIDVQRAREVLDEDHYDLEKVKDRILDYLAVKLLREQRASEFADATRREPIVCFVGPPGVGKTSLGQSIARAMGRTFVHQSLGGIHDEAEIRGHRRTYIGAMPGRIVQALARAEAADPVFMLDEVDKLGAGFHGDPSAALLELLDPAQNQAFNDTYLGVAFDLSSVLFICTANTTETIPPPLLDRMEVIALAGYTEQEKLHIARRYLLPKQRTADGLRGDEVAVSDDAVRQVIRGYTREAGVRSLERELGTVLRKAARRITEGARAPVRVEAGELHDYLGPRRIFDEVAERIDRPGVATGMSWTPSGGDILFVEATMMPGDEDRLLLTGMLGNVMRESAEAALTYLRANGERLGLRSRHAGERQVVHVHVPAGAIPKDGPSAGVTILVALASFALGRPIRGDLAMTGEITLRGKVLPVGGIKEKILAAYRAGLRTIVLPRRNEGDLEEVPREVRERCRFVLVESVDDVLREALAVQPPEHPTPDGPAAHPPLH